MSKNIPTELPDLTLLHSAWQERLNTMITAGTSYADAAQAMLTVAVAGVVQADGVHEAARQMAVVAGFLARADAERQEVRH
jgi:hypothetical protein